MAYRPVDEGREHASWLAVNHKVSEKMQNIVEILNGQQGLAGVQEVLQGGPLRARLGALMQANLADGTHLVACRLQRAKFKPGRKLTAYYDLQLQGPGDAIAIRPIAVTWSLAALTHKGKQQPLALEERSAIPQAAQAVAEQRELGAPFRRLTLTVAEWGMTVQISPVDPHYPQLVQLTDAHYVREQLGALSNGSGSEEPATGHDYSVTTIRYRPSQRHVLRYDPLASSGRVGPATRFAKVYADNQGQQLCTTIHQLADWLGTQTAAVAILRPQANLPETFTVLYPWASGVPLAQWLASDGCTPTAALRQAGAALRLLHNAPASVTQGLPTTTLATEAKSLARTCEHIQLFLPRVGQTIERLCAEIPAAYAALPQEAPTFVHGDWKADHLLVAPTTAAPLTLIDFDTCALADPALDIGKFLADLAWWYTTGQRAGLMPAQQAFLAGYNLTPDHPRLQRARLWAALIGLKMTAHRVPLVEPTWARTTTTMITHYARTLGEAN